MSGIKGRNGHGEFGHRRVLLHSHGVRYARTGILANQGIGGGGKAQRTYEATGKQTGQAGEVVFTTHVASQVIIRDSQSRDHFQGSRVLLLPQKKPSLT